MRLKLDENLGTRGKELFHQAGHDVATVPEQDLCGSADDTIIEICQKEKRCLVTLDNDFGNPFLFKPADYSGIAVLRLLAKTEPSDLWTVIRTLIEALADKKKNIKGKLWIVQRGKIREYQPEN